ncbi:MAG: redoxin family protein [Deltaproteobacteria bacterium]|nr:redoxin family protein [Deltaproteobacteria bacterium]
MLKTRLASRSLSRLVFLVVQFLTLTFLATSLAVVLGCGDGGSGSTSAGAATPADAAAESAKTGPSAVTPANANGGQPGGKPEPKSAPRHPSERPIPAFAGTTLDGGTIEVRDLLGARSVFFFFNPELAEATPVARAVERIHALGPDHNFKVVGVGVGSDPVKLAAFVAAAGISFPVIDDSNASVTQKIQLRAPMGLLGVDPEGYMAFALGHFPKEAELEKQVESDLREALRLEPRTDAAQAGALLDHPDAPELGVVEMSSGKVLETKMLAGKPAIVIFFLHTCPHCHKALQSIKETLATLSEAEKPRLVAISIQNDPSAVRNAMKEHGLDFFDPYLDPGGKATERWGVTGGVPVVHVIDAAGRIRHRGQGWNGARDAGILRMTVAKLSGARVPMLLDPDGYSGNDVCGVCHEQELATWEFTAHAAAYDTLVTHGADRRTDCVGCHVVGFEKKGGYDFDTRSPHLENVGCESCHGRGGPHLSPDFVKQADYTAVCGTCHNPTHSLGFDYASFRPRISHAKIAALSNAERAELRVAGAATRELMPSTAAYVGSNACQSCHAKEFETWSAGPHAHAVATLEKAGKQGEADCLGCHTTAYGKNGGFPAGAKPSSAPDLARVGCESCHGPGGNHVGEHAQRVGTILSLGDKCESCVILKVCGSCHDKANDPGFEFSVEKRIDAQRHGTVESAATREGRSAALQPPSHPLVPLTARPEPG